MRRQVVIPTLIVAAVIVGGSLWWKHRQEQTHVVKNRPTISRDNLVDANEYSPGAGDSASVVVIESTAPRPNAKISPGAAALRLQVQAITNATENPAIRLRSVRTLPQELSFDERAPLLEFLRQRQDFDDTPRGHELKNDVMDALVAQQIPATELPELFVSIYSDPNQNHVIRDYAVQHLSLLSERLIDGVAWEGEVLRYKLQVLEGALWAIAEADKTSIAGTALLGLQRIAESDPSLSQQRLAAIALRLAEAEDLNESARISAIQIAARSGEAAVVPLLLQVLEEAQTSSLRISALGALGLVGGNRELDVLQKISESGDERLSPVAEASVKRIRSRNGGNL
jgi:hypothetical protein